MNLADELQKLRDLHQSGALTAAEYETAKARVLGGAAPGTPPPLPAAGIYAPPAAPLRHTADLIVPTRQWATALHLSQLAGLVVPLLGFAAPIIIWQIKKRELPGLDAHGCHAANWVITECILGLLCIPLVFIFIGVPLLILLGLTGTIFAVIAAIKASNDEVWRYPLAFPFFTPREPVMAPDVEPQPFTGTAPQATDPNRPYGW